MVHRTPASRPIVLLSLVFACAIPLLSCGQPEPSQEVQNLRAFAKMYGYMRFFHPSDEAASIDWDRFAVLGVIRIREMESSEDLLPTMERLFLPMAPTVQIHPTAHPPAALLDLDAHPDSEVVSWQHQGVGLSASAPMYRSKRTMRDLELAIESKFGTIIQSVDAEPFRGKPIKLSARIRAVVAGQGNQGHMWLRVDRPDGHRGFFDNMGTRPVTSAEWQDVEIVGDVAHDASWIVFGGFLIGRGEVWIDDVGLWVDSDVDEWTPIEITNPAFDDGESGGPPEGWKADTPGYEFVVATDSPNDGNRSVKIHDGRGEIITDDLFDARLSVGYFLDAELGAGLSARIPLALPSDESTTLPRGDEHRLTPLLTELDSIAMHMLSAESECTRLAGIVIAWNVLQHFYPYFDVVDVDWDQELVVALEKALVDETVEDYLATLRGMAAALQDGHATVYHPRYGPRGFLPVSVDRVEGQVVVTAEGHPTLRLGDIIETIDGVGVDSALAEIERLKSGSPHFKRSQALFLLGSGEVGSPIELGIRRSDERLDLTVPREPADQGFGRRKPEMIEEIRDGVIYVDLERASMSDIDARMTEIAEARGVVFDLRGYPRGNHNVIGHLLTEPDTSTDWMRVPQIIHPNQFDHVGWQELGWELQPLEPHIGGKVVFITDARAYSYAESILGLVEAYGLAEIVGHQTAGSNGNVNPISLPGGFIFNWTGMKVVKPDGSQHHLIGIRPTVPAEQTIQGVREGRDELLETALEVVARN